jgi:cysteine desulfurase / selenocysteine lyase
VTPFRRARAAGVRLRPVEEVVRARCGRAGAAADRHSPRAPARPSRPTSSTRNTLTGRAHAVIVGVAGPSCIAGVGVGALDVEALRAATPGCSIVAHLNNAGSALPPRCVVDRVIDHLESEARFGGYEAQADAADELAGVYDALATLIGARPHEIAVVENATRGWDMAFYALARRFTAGDRILTTTSEYGSNLAAFTQVAARTGATVRMIPDDEHGQLDLEALDRELERGAACIAINHLPTHDGLVNPAAEVGKRARRAGVPFLLDACQSVGQLPIDVATIGCDLLSATSRKYLRGPRGVGFVYVSDALVADLDPPFVDLHAAEIVAPDDYRLRPDAQRFETWETNVAAKLGLGVAARYATTLGVDALWSRIQRLADALRAGLDQLPGIRVTDRGRTRSGIVTFSYDGIDPGDAVRTLRLDHHINLSVSSPHHAPHDRPTRLRASVHAYNTTAETDRLIAALARMSSGASAGGAG